MAKKKKSAEKRKYHCSGDVWSLLTTHEYSYALSLQATPVGMAAQVSLMPRFWAMCGQ